MSEFHFIRPLWLWALLPYALLLGMLLKSRLGWGNWTQVCDAELLPYLLQEGATQRRRWPQFAMALAGLLAIVSLAGPAWERLPAPVFRNAAALVIALDLSRSMDAEDIKPSRLVRARYKIADILKRRKDGQTALLVYSDEAFTVTPLTDDTDTINSQLSALNTGIMPSGGSNTAAALQRAAALLKQAGLQQGEILLVTDDADGEAALDAAKHLGAYKLSVLAVGTEVGAPIKGDGSGFIKDVQGNIVVAKLNVGGLQRLAGAGGGIMQMLRDDDGDVDRLQTLFERQTRASQKSAEGDERLIDQWRDRGPWLLLAVLPLAAVAFRRGVLCFALLLLLPQPETAYAFSWQDLWLTPDQQGQRAFRKQHYDQAADRFNDPEWKAAAQYKAGQYPHALETLKEPKTADDFYNRGNALAKTGKLQEAIGAYDSALQLKPQAEDAEYNKKLVEKALQQQQQGRQQNGGQEKNRQEPQSSRQNGREQQQGKEQTDAEGRKNDQPSAEQQSSPAEQTQTADHRNRQQQSASETQAAEKQKQREDGEAEENAQAAQMQEQPEDAERTQETKQGQVVQQKPPDEQHQADEQWLKRIPDDPSGLLRRKFAYQYGQRKRQYQGDQQW